MRIINERPPNYEEIAKVFPVDDVPSAIFSYGDRIYNPSGQDLPPEKITHEEAHGVRQLMMNVNWWWARYLNDPQFRLAEELIAYHAEYKHYCANHLGRAERFNYLSYVADELCSSLYDIPITKMEAMYRIKNHVQA